MLPLFLDALAVSLLNTRPVNAGLSEVTDTGLQGLADERCVRELTSLTLDGERVLHLSGAGLVAALSFCATDVSHFS